jgi:hypothetical protein
MTTLSKIHLRVGWKILLTVGFTAFLSGYGTCSWIQHREADRDGLLRFQEFLRVAIDLELVTVNEQRLEELVIAGTEDVPDREYAQ